MIFAIIVFVLRILLFLALISFLGWIVFTLWRELQFQTQLVSSKKIPFISIYRDSEDSDSRQIYTKPELTIGRDPSSDIALDEDVVSLHHARVFFKNKQWWLEDLHSTNATYLNDERVETPTILISGDEIRIGKIVLIVEIQPQE
jgi:pSer/pThr/pTyr-binding forkhead associated (FHA) protein